MIFSLAGCAQAQPATSASTSIDASSAEPSSSESTVTAPSAKTISCSEFYVAEEFARHKAQAVAYDLQGSLVAGTVPHHLLAGQMIASFFARAAQEDYDAVIVLGPSHYPKQNQVITGTLDWSSPFGTVPHDGVFARAIITNSSILAKGDNAGIQLDHAIGGLIPYIASYLPGVPVGVVLQPNGTPPQVQQALAGELARYSTQKKILVVASVDFSHYLMPAHAAQYDEQTLLAVQDFDLDAIRRFDDSNMDSPESISTILQYLQLRQVQVLPLLEHNSSDRILKLPLTNPAFAEGTTTYFVFGAVEE